LCACNRRHAEGPALLLRCVSLRPESKGEESS
jgi:hypothetical protein